MVSKLLGQPRQRAPSINLPTGSRGSHAGLYVGEEPAGLDRASGTPAGCARATSRTSPARAGGRRRCSSRPWGRTGCSASGLSAPMSCPGSASLFGTGGWRTTWRSPDRWAGAHRSAPGGGRRPLYLRRHRRHPCPRRTAHTPADPGRRAATVAPRWVVDVVLTVLVSGGVTMTPSGPAVAVFGPKGVHAAITLVRLPLLVQGTLGSP